MNNPKWLSLISPVSALSMLVMAITFVQSDHQRLAAMQAVIAAYEAHGTPQMVRMSADYDRHFISTDGRIDRIEASITAIQDIRVQLAEIREAQKNMYQQLKQHMEPTK